jgi:hypothetical protein
MSFSQSFVEAFNPAYRQSSAEYSGAQQRKLQAALEAQQRKAEQDAKDAQLQRDLTGFLANYGKSPILNPDGSFNTIANTMQKQSVERMLEGAQTISQQKALDEQRRKAALEDRRLALGIPAASGQQSMPSGWSVMAKAPQPVAQVPMEQQVAQAEAKAKRDAAITLQRQKGQEALAQFLPMLPGGSKSAGYNDDGTFDDATTKALMEAQAQGELAKTRNVGLMNARDDMETMYPDIKPDTPEYNQRLNERKMYHTGGPEYRKAILQVGDVYINDPAKRRQEIDRVAAMGGMESPRAPAELEKSLRDFNTLQQGQQKLLDMIGEYDAKHPEAPFATMVGPIDSKTLAVNLRYNSDANPAAKDAQKILGFYQGLANQRLKDVSGAAVTDGEFARFLKEAGDASSANFVNAIQGWHDATANRFQSQLNATRGYTMPESITTVNGKSPTDWLGYKGQVKAAAAPSGLSGVPAMADIDAAIASRPTLRGRGN